MSVHKKLLTSRLITVYLLILLLWAVPIVGSIIKIQFIEGSFWRKKEESTSLALREVKANRGKIYSADGKTLATNSAIFDVYLDLGKEWVMNKETKQEEKAFVIPDSIFKPQLKKLCDSLTSLFPSISAKNFENTLLKARKVGNRYFLLKKDVSLTQLERMKSFPVLKHISAKKKKKPTQDTIPKIKPPVFRRGVIANRRDVRINPHFGTARRTLGSIDKTGGCDTCYNGLDGYYNTLLKGKKGKRMERRLSKNVWVPINNEDFIGAEDGKDIVSTIDVSLQDLAEKSLRNCLITNDAEKGYVILMEVQTGHVKAISSLYRISPESYVEIDAGACTDLYEPGSTYKTLTMMTLLENDICDTNLKVPTGVQKFGKTTIHDADDKDIGTVSLKKAFEISSNVGICHAVWKGYNQKREDFRNNIHKILPYKKLDVDLMVKEPAPTMLQDMRPDRNFLNIAYGYASNITPLQLLTFYNAIANKGKMVKPMFCSDIKESGKVIKHFEPVVIKDKICSDRTLKKTHELLVGVVENGTAKRLSKTVYGIAGKTGTSQVGYENRNKKLTYCASFAGYFPADQPRYSCVVLIIDPKKNKTHGGELAAPVFKDLADRVCGTKIDIDYSAESGKNNLVSLSALGNFKETSTVLNSLHIPYTINDDSSQWYIGKGISSGKVELSKYNPSKNSTPNVMGMTIKDAIFLLENLGLKVTFEGRGKIGSQSIPSGTAFQKGNIIHLTLR